MERKKKKELLILGVLKSSSVALTSARIARELSSLGHDVSERTVRLYLREMETAGLTVSNGKRGSRITDKGLNEIDSSKIIERVGFLSARIDQMSYGMTFDLNTTSGTVVVNMTMVDPRELAKYADLVSRVYKNGYAMGHLLTFFEPGETLNHVTVPDGMIGIGTVCSITLNGVLLKHGIPTTSRFGGLLELRDRKPVRFSEIIKFADFTREDVASLTEQLCEVPISPDGAAFIHSRANRFRKIILWFYRAEAHAKRNGLKVVSAADLKELDK
ncbi:MAG: NrpR regulatory domain-containing protein [Syntrophorhabdales bacterium]